MCTPTSARAKEAHSVGAYPGFCSTKQLRVLLLPPGWDASPSQGYPQQYVAGIHFSGASRGEGDRPSAPQSGQYEVTHTLEITLCFVPRFWREIAW